jgi:hypothetical protein
VRALREVALDKATSATECPQLAKAVRKLHTGKSLRWIMEEKSLGFQTVRTIVGQVDGTDLNKEPAGFAQPRPPMRWDDRPLSQCRRRQTRTTGHAMLTYVR